MKNLFPSEHKSSAIPGSDNPAGITVESDHIQDSSGALHLVIYPQDDRRTLRWLAALSAQNVPYYLKKQEGCWVIVVPEERGERALAEIHEYERVNRDWPPITAENPGVPHAQNAARDRVCLTSLLAVGMLCLWYFNIGPADEVPKLVNSGAAGARAIRNGELWRCVTALTLHADFGHLFGNAVSLSFFGYFACRRMGAGIGWLAILLAGALGNLVNAWLVTPSHLSLGASTAGFAALGILAFHQFQEKYREQPDLRTVWHRAWVAMAAAVALLALLGTGAGTDVSAHLTGFTCGLLVALLSIPILHHNRNVLVNSMAYGLFWIIIIGAWQLAS